MMPQPNIRNGQKVILKNCQDLKKNFKRHSESLRNDGPKPLYKLSMNYETVKECGKIQDCCAAFHVALQVSPFKNKIYKVKNSNLDVLNK